MWSSLACYLGMTWAMLCSVWVYVVHPLAGGYICTYHAEASYTLSSSTCHCAKAEGNLPVPCSKHSSRLP